MSKNLFRVGACLGAVLGASFVGVQADEKPIFLPPVPPTLSEANPVGVTSLTVAFPTSSPSDAQKLLDAPVSFDVKDASFMVALDALLTASGKTCRIECRSVKPMKLTFSAIKMKAGDLLHSLALTGGCDLYVFPDKLLLSPPDLLLESEKTKARPFQVLLPLTLAQNNKSFADTLRAAHTRINTSFSNKQVGDAISDLIGAARKQGVGIAYHYTSPWSHIVNGPKFTYVSMSIDNMTLGEALNAVAHQGGCNVYLLPGEFRICAPETSDDLNRLQGEERKNAVSAFVTPDDLTASAGAS